MAILCVTCHKKTIKNKENWAKIYKCPKCDNYPFESSEVSNIPYNLKEDSSLSNTIFLCTECQSGDNVKGSQKYDCIGEYHCSRCRFLYNLKKI